MQTHATAQLRKQVRFCRQVLRGRMTGATRSRAHIRAQATTKRELLREASTEGRLRLHLHAVRRPLRESALVRTNHWRFTRTVKLEQSNRLNLTRAQS